MNDTKRCLLSTEKSDITDVLKEDMTRDQMSINSIEKNRDLVKALSTRSPDELIKMYNSHLARSSRLLQTIDMIPSC